MTRTQRYLVAALAVQVVLILFFRSPLSGANAPVEPERLFPKLESATAARLELLGAGGDETALELVRRGDAWTVPTLDDFPADALKIDGLIETLGSLEVRRPVVSTRRYHESFEVGDDGFQGRIRVFDATSDEPRADLILGSTSNYRTTHARRAGDDRVWEIRGLSPWEIRPDANAWIRRELLDVDESEIVGITVRNPSGTLELELVDGTWQANGEAVVDGAKADALVRAAVELRLTEAAARAPDATYGLDDPVATIELRLPGESVTIEIGRNSDEANSQRFVRVAGSERAGTIWETTAAQFLEVSAANIAGGS